MSDAGEKRREGSDGPAPGTATPFIFEICAALIPLDSVNLTEPEKTAVAHSVAGFVQCQLDLIPQPTQMAFALGMLGFRLWVRVKYLRGFMSLTPAQRREAGAAWAWGRFALARQLFRVLRSTTFLAFFEAPEVRSALEQRVESGPGPGATP